MKVYDKYLNEEKDRLVEVHTEWLKEIDGYIKNQEDKIEKSELKLLETEEIFIERFERLERRIKELENHDKISFKIDENELVQKLNDLTERSIALVKARVLNGITGKES
ncbi:TPA: hypothetical protein U4T39_002062 [Streptococcus agalactiae]|nr:hypothetical protein [Streptococcus agalactiae]HEO5205439.1 hypothetical protein [Streptococcus agalactiae]HEO6848334.1 hypothetical protein [Streptococcus agalactiae]HEO6998889.1 hypothetical protein [Streptococcus agalactiae]HEO7024957.1 hypothetical protein [Streptococcus agalactiae]